MQASFGPRKMYEWDRESMDFIRAILQVRHPSLPPWDYFQQRWHSAPYSWNQSATIPSRWGGGGRKRDATSRTRISPTRKWRNNEKATRAKIYLINPGFGNPRPFFTKCQSSLGPFERLNSLGRFAVGNDACVWIGSGWVNTFLPRIFRCRANS